MSAAIPKDAYYARQKGSSYKKKRKGKGLCGNIGHLQLAEKILFKFSAQIYS